MFRTVPLSIIRSFFAVHTTMEYVIQVCRQLENRNRMGLCSKINFEKLVHLVCFIIRICHDARSHERKITKKSRRISFYRHHWSPQQNYEPESADFIMLKFLFNTRRLVLLSLIVVRSHSAERKLYTWMHGVTAGIDVLFGALITVRMWTVHLALPQRETAVSRDHWLAIPP
jgi:hypothetical protein